MARHTAKALYLALLGGAAGCSDYNFNKGPTDPGRPIRGDHGSDDTAASTPDDTAPPAEADDPTPGDTADPPDTDPPDSGGVPSEDPCYEPEDGYESNPAARIFTTDSVTAATVTLILSDTGYQDSLTLDSPESVALADAWIDPMGTSRSLGPYATDSELIFGINVWNTGEHWQSGPSSRNSDGIIHVAVTYEGACSWLIGFEDLTGGGDLDYNDVVLRVQGALRQED